MSLRFALIAVLLALALPAPAASTALVSVNFASPDGTATGLALVAVPPANPARGKPGVLLLLHGAGGSEKTWSSWFDTMKLAAEWHRVVVCLTLGPNSWYLDRQGFAGETAITKGLLPQLAQTYGTSDDRWIVGFSMGGFGALNLGLRNPDLFTAAGGIGACVSPSRWGGAWGLTKAMGPPAQRGTTFDLFTPAAVAQMKTKPYPVLGLAIGDKDQFRSNVSAAHKELETAGIPHYWHWMPGFGHSPETCIEALPLMLAAFTERLAQGSASAAPGARARPASAAPAAP